jgi:hypothetical protein
VLRHGARERACRRALFGHDVPPVEWRLQVKWAAGFSGLSALCMGVQLFLK